MNGKILLCVLVSWSSCMSAVVVAGRGGDLTDPIEILRKADAAARAVKTIKYTASSSNTDPEGSPLYRVEGTVVMTGWSAGAPSRYRCDALLTSSETEETRRYTVGNNEQVYFFIDHGTRTAYVDTDPSVVGSTGGRTHQLRRPEFTHPTPFSDELNGDKQDLIGSLKIGDEDCYVLQVVYAMSDGDTTWYFSKKDFLPRGCDRMMRGVAGRRLINKWRLTKLTVDPKLAKDTFSPALPDGYKKTDDFAP